jgi:hypothetical protein
MTVMIMRIKGLIREINYIINKITPSIHNLPNVIYIKWFGYEWYIQKGENW